MKQHHIILFFLLTLTTSLFGQKDNAISKETKEVVREITKINEYIAGISLRETCFQQNLNFEKLKEIATIQELISLTDYPNGVVRSYAFTILSNTANIDLFPIIIKHINDDELVVFWSENIGIHKMVGDYFIDNGANQLDLFQLVKLDSLLIYTYSKLKARSNAILRAKPTETLYPKLREFVLKKKEQSALVKLAQYRKEQDIPIILNNREEIPKVQKGEKGKKYRYVHTYKAIQEYPHEKFIPLLERNLSQILAEDDYCYYDECQALYDAIAAYKNEKAIELLQMPLMRVENKYTWEHTNYIFNAIRNYKEDVYVELFWKLWREEKRIQLDIFNFLYEKDSAKTIEYTKQTLSHLDNLWSADFSTFPFNRYGIDSLVNTMFDMMLDFDYNLTIELINENIKNTENRLHFPILTNRVIELKDKAFIEPLFNRLEIEYDPYIYLKIVEALISFQDESINKRIIEIRR